MVMKRVANGEPMIIGVTDFSVILFLFCEFMIGFLKSRVYFRDAFLLK